ncbi:hypothetical protein Q3V23_19035 [Streptomyces sp. VNUA116]|uniref:hypothetical protein n=1 Tax=Streptomyces sp. VNUA116 TaxID=3062449 RepID=UPI002675D083|nr:hypothetical protein [Streptomyces sp. VNUA116]WKU45985.1 hypothetical protein Q3V23_19035 [Streptomyces sp. VNUA116]
MEITGRVRQSSHPRQSTEQAQHARHIVLDAPMTGRLRREAGDALCRPAVDFYDLERTDIEGDATCKKCVERAARYGVRVITAGAADAAEAEEIAASLTPKMREVLPAVVAASPFRDHGLAALPYGVTYPSLQALIRRGLAEKYETDETVTSFTGKIYKAQRYRATDKGLAVHDVIISGAVRGTERSEQDVVEPVDTAQGSTPSDATHPDVVAARKALDGIAAATMTDHHDPSEPTEAEQDVRGYLIEPRSPGSVRIHWLEDGGIGRFRLPNDVALDRLTDRLTQRGWTVRPRHHTSRFVIAERPTENAGSTPAAPAEAQQLADEPSDVWTIMTRAEVEIARVEGATVEDMTRAAKALPEVRANIAREGGFARRRLYRSELAPAPTEATVEDQAEAELHDTIKAVEQAEAAHGTWRGGWIASTPPPFGEGLFDLGPDTEQGALFT